MLKQNIASKWFEESEDFVSFINTSCHMITGLRIPLHHMRPIPISVTISPISVSGFLHLSPSAAVATWERKQPVEKERRA